MEEIVIELSKVKILLLTIGAAIFVLLGIWLLSMDVQEIESQRRFNSPTLIYGVGIVSIVFFGLCGLIGVKKFFVMSTFWPLPFDAVARLTSFLLKQ